MKKLYNLLLLPLFYISILAACTDDEGNYNYMSQEEIGVIKIDTIGMDPEQVKLLITVSMNAGDTIVFDPHVDYKYKERLRYRWFYLTLKEGQYKPVLEGNKQVYPPADTIARTKKLDWVCDLKPGMYRFYFMAEDTISGARNFMQINETFISVNQSGALRGLYLLTETIDGNTDIEVLNSQLQFITGFVDAQYFHYYSKKTGRTLPGKPLFIRPSSDGKSKKACMVATDQNMWRLNSVGLQTMNEWNSMFYETPTVFNPQNNFIFGEAGNTGEFLINDGKLHVLYTDKANDLKFSAPIAGNYKASDFLMGKTKTNWNSLAGAIGADQVIYDKQNHCFRPYFSKASSISSFGTTNIDAILDANTLPADPIVIMRGTGNSTYAILNDNGTYWLHRYLFYNVKDDGDLSYLGSSTSPKTDLSGCSEIANAKYFACSNAANAFYYATDKAVYSFSPTSGNSASRLVYSCSANETVTTIHVPGVGGWPTGSCMFYIALWDSNKQEGKLLEFEMDHTNGIPTTQYTGVAPWNNMIKRENPTITTGWGKIISICSLIEQNE